MAVASSVSDLPLRSTSSFTRFPGLRLEMASRAWRASAIFLPSIAAITAPGWRARGVRRPAAPHADHHHALGVVEFEGARDLRRDRLRLDSEPAANRPAVLQNFLHHV